MKGGHTFLNDETSAPRFDAAGAARVGVEGGTAGARGLAAMAAWSQHALALAAPTRWTPSLMSSRAYSRCIPTARKWMDSQKTGRNLQSRPGDPV